MACLAVLAAGSAFTVVGCPPPEADDRPGRTQIGDDGGRSTVPIGGRTGGSAGSGAGGSAGAVGGSVGTGGTLSDWPTTTLVAAAFEITEFNTLPEYSTSPIFTFAAHPYQVTVVAQGKNEATFVVKEAVDETFQIDGVRKAEDTWVRVSSEGPGTMDVLHQVDTADAAEDAVFVIDRDLMTSVLSQAQASFSYEPNTAHAIVRVIDEDRGGVAGVVVQPLGGEVLFRDDANLWSSTAEYTDISGLALVANLTAAERDGEEARISVDGATHVVPVYPDTVTIVEIQAP